MPPCWYMISNANPWDNLKFDLDGIEEVRNKFSEHFTIPTAFSAFCANLDGFEYAEAEVPLKK